MRRVLLSAFAVLLFAACEEGTEPFVLENADGEVALSPTEIGALADQPMDPSLPAPKGDVGPREGMQLASHIGVPVPADLIISHEGLEWVWAAPCTAGSCGTGIDVGHDGFEYATDEQWAARPPVTAFGSGYGDMKCAAPYFSFRYNHCDWGDGQYGAVSSKPYDGSNGNWETWLVRIGDPQTKDECKNGGWEQFGFKNQGQCVRFIETGKDSR